MFVVYFLTSSLVGSTPPRIVRAGARRLNTDIGGVADQYTEKVDDYIVRHRVIERIGRAHETSKTKQQCKAKLDCIDKETKEQMKASEKRCRRIKSGRIRFSPESSRWIRRAQVYRSILRYHGRTIRNRGNLKRAARRCDISRPLGMPLAEVRLRLKECKKKCNYFRKHGRCHRRRHLNDRLKNTKS